MWPRRALGSGDAEGLEMGSATRVLTPVHGKVEPTQGSEGRDSRKIKAENITGREDWMISVTNFCQRPL